MFIKLSTNLTYLPAKQPRDDGEEQNTTLLRNSKFFLEPRSKLPRAQELQDAKEEPSLLDIVRHSWRAQKAMKEVPLWERMLPTNKALTDVILEGNDGVKVWANRRDLGARSEVFESMLLGPFQEASQDVVRIGFYDGEVLKAVVEYVHSDTTNILDDEIHDTPERIQTLVSLVGAAEYFDLPELGIKAKQRTLASIRKSPSLAFVLFEVCRAAGPVAPIGLQESALSAIRSTIIDINDSYRSAVGLLSESSLEEILKDDEIPAGEGKLFDLLLHWIEGGVNGEEEPMIDDDFTTIANRKRVGSQLVKHIHLEWIDPTILATTAASSGLVSFEQLAEAFRFQAVTAAAQYGVSFNKARLVLPKWKISQDQVSTADESDYRAELLDIPDPMISGTYQWTIEVERDCNLGVDLGLVFAASARDWKYDDWLGSHQNAWVLGHEGATFCEGVESAVPGLHFGAGSKVTFKLSLDSDREAGNGCLIASVDGGQSVQLFSNLRDNLKDTGKGGFIPACTMKKPGRVRLLDFHRVGNE